MGLSVELGEEELELLRNEAGRMGVALGREALEKLRMFAGELAVWGSRVNLISCGSAVELVRRHLLDSLAAAPFVAEAKMSVDLGSGAGLPGIPLALVSRGRWHLVEARRKRANFLRQVVRRLELGRVQVWEERVEDGLEGLEGQCGAVTSRAVWEPRVFLERAARLLKRGGVAVAFVGVEAEVETGVGGLCLMGGRRVEASGKQLLIYRMQSAGTNCFT